MTNVQKSFQIELDHIELLNCIASLTFAINLVNDEDNTPKNHNHSCYLAQLQEKLTNHLSPLAEDIDQLFIKNTNS